MVPPKIVAPSIKLTRDVAVAAEIVPPVFVKLPPPLPLKTIVPPASA